jgi:tetratricopeptide (TPR) repeat protein
MTAAFVMEDASRARTLLDRAVRRAAIDSIPDRERNYGFYLAVAAAAGDTVRARTWHAESRRRAEALGNTAGREAGESLADAQLAIAEGRYEDAREKLDEADRRNHSRTDILSSLRFFALDRLERTDSAIVAGEAYVAGSHPQRLSQDVAFLAGIRQRLGEMYEQKGNVDKALEHYTAFVELWKDADAELQPRVRDVRSRVERLQRRRG